MNYKRNEGQGLVEYSLVLVLAAVVVILLIAIFGGGIAITEDQKYDRYEQCIRDDKDKEFCAVRWAE